MGMSQRQPGEGGRTGEDAGIAGPKRSPLVTSDRSRQALLVQFVCKQVIPKLADAHGLLRPSQKNAADCDKPSPEALIALANLAVTESASSVVAYAEALMNRGIAIETVYLEWIAPAARQMGCDWASDRCDFSAVTIGMWNLQQALHMLSPVFLRNCAVTTAPRRLLLTSVPGEQHTMGLYMASEFFRRAGWDVWSELPADYDDVIGKARSDWFDLVGLSVGGEHKLDGLTQAIAVLRRESRNPDVLIMVGGPILVSNPELAVALGVDFTAADALQAVSMAEKAVAFRISEQFRR
jgi:MerR family transcriptional regulator, light-induced transcriptional regulator